MTPTLLPLVAKIVIPLMMAFAVYRFVRLVFPDEAAAAARERLGVGGIRSEQPSLTLKIMRPLFPLFEPIAELITLERYREMIRRRFVTAGMADEVTPGEFLAWKLMMMLFTPGMVYLLLGKIWGPAWYYLVLFGLLGLFYPDFWLNSIAKARQNRISRQLPYVMDLLTLSVEAGLDFVGSMTKVVDKSKPGPLTDELRYFLQEIQVGTTRSQSLRNLAWRIDLIQVSSFSALLVQADKLGASIGPVLRAQSDLLRAQRFSKAEEQGAAASVKILFPLILCIMPAVIIVVFGPIILSLLYGEGIVPPEVKGGG